MSNFDSLDNIFKSVISEAKKEHILKEPEDDTLDVRSLWGNDRSDNRIVDSSPLTDTSTNHSLENPPQLSFDTPPVVNFGFEPSFNLNFENNQPTYRESRSFRADVISFIERYYFEHTDLPPHQLLHDTFKDYPEAPRYIKNWKQLIEELKNSDGHSIQDQLEFRGLPTYRTGEDYLEPQFISACHLILNPHDRRSDASKLKDVGVTSAKWNAWLKRRPYRIYYQKHADKIFDEETQVEAKRSLDRLVRKDDLSAIKYVDERTGIYRSSTQNIEIVGMFMQAIFSILARNVPSNVINIIQAEIREEPIMKKFLADAIEIQEAKAV